MKERIKERMKMIKPYHTFHFHKFYLAIGWFPGEPFKLVSLTILELGIVQPILDIQIAKLCLSFGFD